MCVTNVIQMLRYSRSEYEYCVIMMLRRMNRMMPRWYQRFYVEWNIARLWSNEKLYNSIHGVLYRFLVCVT